MVTCPGVGEIWAYGDATRNFLVGVVVPDPIAIVNIAKELGIEGELENLCAD